MKRRGGTDEHWMKENHKRVEESNEDEDGGRIGTQAWLKK